MGNPATRLTLEIVMCRQGGWAAVSSRHHVLGGVYPKSDDSELMLYGTVEYGLKNGRRVKAEWAARMIMAEGKISFYQVYVDASPLLVAQGKTIRGDENGEVRVE